MRSSRVGADASAQQARVCEDLRARVARALRSDQTAQAAFFGDKLVTMSAHAPQDVALLATAYQRSRQYGRAVQLLETAPGLGLLAAGSVPDVAKLPLLRLAAQCLEATEDWRRCVELLETWLEALLEEQQRAAGGGGAHFGGAGTASMAGGPPATPMGDGGRLGGVDDLGVAGEALRGLGSALAGTLREAELGVEEAAAYVCGRARARAPGRGQPPAEEEEQEEQEEGAAATAAAAAAAAAAAGGGGGGGGGGTAAAAAAAGAAGGGAEHDEDEHEAEGASVVAALCCLRANAYRALEKREAAARWYVFGLTVD
jgi:hypothetical protein